MMIYLAHNLNLLLLSNLNRLYSREGLFLMNLFITIVLNNFFTLIGDQLVVDNASFRFVKSLCFLRKIKFFK